MDCYSSLLHDGHIASGSDDSIYMMQSVRLHMHVDTVVYKVSPVWPTVVNTVKLVCILHETCLFTVLVIRSVTAVKTFHTQEACVSSFLVQM